MINQEKRNLNDLCCQLRYLVEHKELSGDERFEFLQRPKEQRQILEYELYQVVKVNRSMSPRSIYQKYCGKTVNDLLRDNSILSIV